MKGSCTESPLSFYLAHTVYVVHRIILEFERERIDLVSKHSTYFRGISWKLLRPFQHITSRDNLYNFVIATMKTASGKAESTTRGVSYTPMRPVTRKISGELAPPVTTAEEQTVVYSAPAKARRRHFSATDERDEPKSACLLEKRNALIKAASLPILSARLEKDGSFCEPIVDSQSRSSVLSESKPLEEVMAKFMVVSCSAKDRQDEDDDGDDVTENHTLLPMTSESLFRRERMISCVGYEEFSSEGVHAVPRPVGSNVEFPLGPWM